MEFKMAYRMTRVDKSTRKSVYVSNFFMAIFFGTFGCLLGMLLSLMSNVTYSDYEKNRLLKAGSFNGTGIALSIWLGIAAVIMIVNGTTQTVNIGLIVGGIVLIAAGIALIILCVKKHNKLLTTINEKETD
jgi:uncharacterized membrane protein YidH (DUF202 family)